MARVRANMGAVDRLMRDLNSLKIENIAPEMLEEAGEILLDAVKDHVRPHRETGSLESGIRKGKPKRAKDGYSISVAPHGKDSKGVSNMDKLAYLEYGTGHKGWKGGTNMGIQRATPVLFPAVNSCRRRCEDAMQKVFERKCDSL